MSTNGREHSNVNRAPQDETFNTLTYRKDPFPDWINKYIDTANATFVEMTASGPSLYQPACQFVLTQTKRSFRGQAVAVHQKSNTTKLLEELAKDRLRKQQGDSEIKIADEPEPRRYTLELGLGLHEFDFGGERLWALHQTIGDPLDGGYICTTLVVFVEGTGRRDMLEKFCEGITCKVEAQCISESPLFFELYRWDHDYGSWEFGGHRLRRELDTIVLPKVQKDRVLADMDDFLNEDSLRWYFEHGIPYRRSYLFYGVPGSGKSSLIQALAGRFGRKLCFLQPMHQKMTDDQFKSCLERTPNPSLIVLEDVDALFGKDRSKKHPDCPLTFSGLLNGLDGVGGLDGQIVIMTTNFVDRLDEALIRSGRVDLRVEFGMAVDEQIVKMFDLFCPGESAELAEEFLGQIRRIFPQGISMASLQQHFILQKKQPGRVVVDTVFELAERLDVITKFDERVMAEYEKTMAEHEDGYDYSDVEETAMVDDLGNVATENESKLNDSADVERNESVDGLGLTIATIDDLIKLVA